MRLYKVVLILKYKYKKTYLVFAEGIYQAKILAELDYEKKHKGILNAPEIIDYRIKEYTIKRGVINV